jgi:peptidoglycan/xylan/chitin deacetylase (PgdA/CDA1 family)
MTTWRDALGRTAAFLLLPLSLLPIYMALPRLKAEFGSPAKEFPRTALPVIDVRFSADEVNGYRALPIKGGAIPVLAYHGINDQNDTYSVSRRTFASHMEMLHRSGFRAITIQQYVRFLKGDRKGLPPRPVLITFDDGRLDSYRGADKVLARFDFRATMFVIAHDADHAKNFYLNWDDLRRMARGGNWDIQEHAGEGHYEVRVDAHGRKGPFYAYRRYTKEGLESFEQYKARVTRDVLWGMRRLSEEVPGFAPLSFALPFGNFGQVDTNDPRIPRFFNHFLRRHFQAVFVVKPAAYTTAQTRRWQIGRYELRTYTTAGRLYNWLQERLPTSTGALRVPPLWCKPGWKCVPGEGASPAVPRVDNGPIQVAQRSPSPASGVGQATPAVTTAPAPTQVAEPHPSGGSGAPLSAAGGPSPQR